MSLIERPLPVSRASCLTLAQENMRILVLVASLFFVGCSKGPDWYHGAWVVEVPEEKITADSPPGKIAAGMWAHMFANGTVTVSAETLTFDLGERTMTKGYLIAEHLSSSEIRIVLDDDAVHRIRRTDVGIDITTNGSGDLKGAKDAWVSFKPKPG